MIQGKKISYTCLNNSGSFPILKELSFELKKGRITTFIGPSGAGKTSLLKCIANLINYDQGEITYEGADIKFLSPIERASTIGFVFQQFHLFPHLTVLKNCTYALVKTMGISLKTAEEKAAEILQLLGMHPFLTFLPSQLSGGQQQRVAIARALVLRPKILLFDEPTSALDPESKKNLESLLIDLSFQGITLGISSHDMAFIKKIKGFVYFIEQGEIIEKWDQEIENISSKEKINKFLSDI